MKLKTNLRVILWIISLICAISAFLLFRVIWIFIPFLIFISVLSLLTAEYTYMAVKDDTLIMQYLGLKQVHYPLNQIEGIGDIDFHDCVLRQRALRVYNFNLQHKQHGVITINTNWLKPYGVIELLDAITNDNRIDMNQN